ncbi:unnamed protein product [Bursaphelenchus xylophilus]|uniref:guanylate cyclase n=1 Tax=Bursaphelenchus xylophilus TaxID=6326 RepID=A0A1I7RXN1_BURXY|nr:unnamed protein product [Bursaphelenchus xylophilus]CAG9126602.1 unnamed protein product [Bursaphelenchus xylophilus]
MIESEVGFAGSAGAVSLAVEFAREQGLLNNINLTFEWRFSDGEDSSAAGYATQMLYGSRVHAIFGPVKSTEQVPVNALASYNYVPHFIWGKPCPYSFKEDPDTFNSTVAMSGTALGSVVSMIHVCDKYQWSTLAFLFMQPDNPEEYLPYCGSVASTIDDALNKYSKNITIAYKREITNRTLTNYKRILSSIDKVARITVVCFDNDYEKRQLMLAASELRMIGGDYLYLFMQSDGSAYRTPPLWDGDDGRDDEAKTAFMSTLIIDKPTAILSADYNERVTELVKEYPWYCDNCSTATGNASSLSYYLGDAVLIYIAAINRTIQQYQTDLNLQAILRNSSYVLPNMPVQMPSVEGDNVLIFNGRIRGVINALYGLDTGGSQNIWATITSSNNSSIFNLDSFMPNYTSGSDSIWAVRGGHRPLNEPECGYEGNECAAPAWTYVVISGASVILFITLLLLLSGCVLWFQRRQRQRLNALWQVDYAMLMKPDRMLGAKSQRSISNSFSFTNPENGSYDNIQLFYYQYELVVGRKFQIFNLNTAIEAELREIRLLDHPQLNRFLGLTYNGQIGYQLYRYCERGTIENVIDEYKDRIDDRIVNSMIMNVVEGLSYIHSSPYGALGCLNAESCLVDDRFQVKLQYYGMDVIKQNTKVALTNKKVLYIAPELLRLPIICLSGTKPGDIYSLSILLAQIVTRHSVWSIKERNLNIEEVCRRVIKKTEPLERPSLEHDNNVYIDTRLQIMIQNCMEERPENRPEIQHVKSVVKSLDNKKSSNLMDYMFALMEDRAMDLEQQVQSQTAELLDEQRKANLLLYRMMPASAVDVLRRGESVKPELYDMATVFFSDIVGFTVLSSKSSPLQIISFLNQVYTMTDDIIDQHDVYKVETIGDGLHCVSGIPTRNENNHVREIADMALALQKSVKLLYLPHLPNEKIQMRFGIHSGPCVTGIVGITAPRYCVFGNTVSLAAKMESSSKPGRIHVSPTSKELIDQFFRTRFHLVERGEIHIKNHDVMRTYWLVPASEVEDFQA